MNEFEKTLLKIARKTIEDSFTGTLHFDKQTLLWLYPKLTDTMATFVTLTINNNLRGCIGSLAPHRMFLDDIIANSYAAAFKDPRFKPLSKAEASMVNIEISVLTPPQNITFSSKEELQQKLTLGKDGVILESEGKRATYLPHVWNQFNSFDEFFSSLAKKGNIEGELYNKSWKVFSYKTRKLSEI
ncbi:MAG: AmmeMemoRadiSam system protein A [Campylobacterales bacterium]|nr:AmmeMemoRadiSam system protein A [Campylobacterales bacterium]